MLPRALDFLLGVAAENVENVTGIHEYISFVTRIILWVGVAYQLPMVLALAGRLGLVTAGQLLRFWRYAIVLVFIPGRGRHAYARSAYAVGCGRPPARALLPRGALRQGAVHAARRSRGGR